MLKKWLTALALSVCMMTSAFTAGAGRAGTLYTTAAAKPKLAKTSVSVSEGSYWLNNATGEFETYKKPDGLGSARVDLDRGVVVTDADERFLTLIPALDGAQPFGPKSFHGVDYALFFYDIVKNVQVRTESYRAEK